MVMVMVMVMVIVTVMVMVMVMVMAMLTVTVMAMATTTTTMLTRNRDVIAAQNLNAALQNKRINWQPHRCVAWAFCYLWRTWLKVRSTVFHAEKADVGGAEDE